MSKLGPHVINPSGPALDWARAAPIVKAFGSTTPLQAAPGSAIRIYRRYFASQALGDPDRAADEILGGLGGYRHPNLYVETYNEAHQRRGAGLEPYVSWTRTVVARCHAAGVKVAGFSFSTGQPEPSDWAYLADEGFAGVDALAVHEYWGFQGFSGWNALRYRKIRGWIGGRSHPPILMTECGRDAVEGGRGGWKRDGISPAAYLDELRAYDAEISRDGYVLGATVFTAGPSADWTAFDVDELVPALLGAAPPPGGGTPPGGGGGVPLPIVDVPTPELALLLGAAVTVGVALIAGGRGRRVRYER